MKLYPGRRAVRSGAANILLTCALLAPAPPAGAQVFPRDPPPAPKPERKENRPPVPPGVPSTPDNVHLPTEGEVKLGREGTLEVEKEYKFLSSGPYYERLQRVAREVVKAIQREDIIAEYRRVYRLPKSNDRTLRVPFEFSFKVVDSDKLINAFSLAGGPVYVTKGLLNYATSDHELAAVLAHECSHVAFHHVEQLVKRQKKLNSTQMWALLATVIAGAAGGGAVASAATNAMVGAQLVSIATLTGYGRELESEADRVAVRALYRTGYNPVGMLTFMQKLARDDRLRGNPDFGIYQSHPYSNERVSALKKQLEELGFRLDPGTLRQVSGTFRVVPVFQEFNGREAVELRLNGGILFVVVAGEDGLSPVDRAGRISRQIEDLFAENLGYNDVRRSPDKTVVLLKGVPVIRVYPEDAAVLGSAEAAAERAFNEIHRALLKEQLDRS